jgi:hypothetical protein
MALLKDAGRVFEQDLEHEATSENGHAGYMDALVAV